MGASSDLRLAELLGALSLVTDLGMAHPPEEAMKASLIATRLARSMGVFEPDVSDIFYASMLRFLGCNGPAHEESALTGGDDVGVRDPGAYTDFHTPKEAMAFTLRLGQGNPPLRRIGIIGKGLASGKRAGALIHTSFCEAAATTARRLGLPPTIANSLLQIFERWDGKGENGLAGEEIPLPARFAQFAGLALIFQRLGGADSAIEILESRSGKSLDPSIAKLFAKQGAAMLDRVQSEDVFTTVLDEEPEPHHLISEGRVDEVADAFADLTDLKSPLFHGHSSGVAELAESAATSLGLPEADVTAVRRAALFHDLGRMGIRNGIWEKPNSLNTSEWEQVRLHAYHTERILGRSAILSSVASIAGMHHERQDGSGYHRQSSGAENPLTVRVLAAADAYQAMTQDRAHRPAFDPKEASKHLVSDAEEGKLDRQAVEAVLAAAGQVRKPVRRQWPSGLTDREVEVLRLVARGLSIKQIASQLSIAPKTADHHIQSIYSKAQIKTRAGAALFAMEHDLLR